MAQTIALEVFKKLKKIYPDAKCSLDYRTPFELLVATILSAQCTDARVNKVTPELFKIYPSAKAMAQAPLEKLEALIQSTGFYKNKAKSLSETSKALVKEFKGEVPKELETLTKLRGIGRKTANVVLGNAYGIPGLPVDTHVGRLARRLGLTRHEDPVKVEHDLMKLLPPKYWTLFSHLLIYHGRAVCQARKPLCDQCVIAKLCPKRGVVLKTKTR